MVQTFFVYYDPANDLWTNFILNARYLDNVRLPNQRREGLMILRSIRKIKGYAQMLDMVMPSDPYQWYDWIRLVLSTYKNTSIRIQQQLLYQDGQWRWRPLSDQLYICQKTPKLFEGAQRVKPVNNDIGGLAISLSLPAAAPDPYQDQVILSTGKRVDRCQCLFTDDIHPGFGYIYHPCVLQWLGYEPALCLYLNAMIYVTMERGFGNNMPYETVDQTQLTVPVWANDPDIYLRHRTMLLAKEIDRKEPIWYQQIPMFLQAQTSKHYFWPFAPKCDSKQGLADTTKRYQIIPGKTLQ